MVFDISIVRTAVKGPNAARNVRYGAIWIVESFIVNQIRSQTCGGQTGHSKGEEIFLHRQFWIGCFDATGPDFPCGGVPISNYNTYVIRLMTNTRNRTGKCKRLV